MLKRLILTTAMSLTALSSAWAEGKLPVTGKTCSELLAFYKDLPFTSVLPLPDGPVSVPGKTGDITVGFSQTGFNHPWRTAMLAALQAEACRHPNIKIVVVDGNVDVAKQNNDVRDLLARVAHIDTLTRAGRAHALRRVKDTEVLLAAGVAQRVLESVHAKTRARGAA